MAPVVRSSNERNSFKVLRLKDGRVLVDSPVTLTRTGRETSDMLVVSLDGVSVQDRKAVLPSQDLVSTTVDAFAVLGVIHLCFGKYLLVVTHRTLAATIQSHKVWRIIGGLAIQIGTSADVPLLKAKETMDEHELAQFTLDQELLSNINALINSQHLYYSSTYDITHSIQHNHLLNAKAAHHTNIDSRYFFNAYVQEPISRLVKGNGERGDAEPWVFKVICGFAGSIDIKVKPPSGFVVQNASGTGEETYTVTLISRLNHRRLGTRYVRRGLDWEGNAANNVEMEQIVFHHDFSANNAISSFVQVRGSAPSIWGQELNLDYRPDLLIADINKPEVWGSISAHYKDLSAQYVGEKGYKDGSDLGGKVVCVNLLDDKGFERELTQTYERTVAKFGSDRVTYEEFPVNKWCKKMNFRNMDILVDRVRDRLINSGCFVAEGQVPTLSGFVTTPLTVNRLQTGIARVSCLDSLDRTNLTCSIFAKYMIPFQLRALSDPVSYGALPPVDGQSLNDVRDPVAAIRATVEPSVRVLTNLWADSGDAISLLYAGTRALKSDVTRTGKRQWIMGSIDDGLNSLARYYLNNFSDGRKQDGYDLWTGKASSEQIRGLAETEGAKKAKQIQKPFLEKGKGITGFLLPSFVIDRVEPLLQAASDFASTTMEEQMRNAQQKQLETAPKTPANGGAAPETTAAKTEKASTPTVTATATALLSAPSSSYINFLVSAIKIYAPEQVSNVVEFVVAMVVFFYILVLVKIFQIKGQTVVDRPKLSYEYQTIHEVLD